MNRNKFISLELAGLIFTLVIGIMLRYSIGIFGVNLWTMLISSVNFSIWEGTKVFVFSYLIWMCFEYCVIKVPIRNFVVSKVLGMYTLLAVGLFVFWAINGKMGLSNFLIDAVLMFITIGCAYAVSCKFILCDVKLNDFFVLSLFCIALFLAMYFYFVINPPHTEIFMDKYTYTYGLQFYF